MDWSAQVGPSAVNKVLGQPTYSSFLSELEHGPHVAIPIFIRGDFFKFTGPNGMGVLKGWLLNLVSFG